MTNPLYRHLIRPVVHKIKRFRNFLRSLIVCMWRGWDIRLVMACDIHLSKVPRSTRFQHPVGIVISSGAVLGEHCTIRQNVTIGLKDEQEKKYPVLGDHVQVGAGATILGDVKIGDHAVIGAGALVLHDIPARATFYNRAEPRLKPPEPEST